MGRQVSEGKSVKVTAPEGGVIKGNFYEIEGFVGISFDTVEAGKEVALEVDLVEYETSQIDTSTDFLKGTTIYWNGATHTFTETANTDMNFIGKVTNPKDANNVIWFKRML